ncbi:MAG: FecR family protein [Mangrovibacterium sp.]
MHSGLDIHQIIIHFFSGEAGEEEKHALKKWLAKDSRNKKLFNDLKEIWESSEMHVNPDQYDVDLAVARFKRRIKAKSNDSHRWNVRQWGRYAAVVLFVLSLPIFFYWGKASRSVSGTTTTVWCAQGDKTSVILPDSSLVWLNSGSRLIFNSDFRSGSRLVCLEGEAYFSVKKDPDRPFHVRTSGLDVTVLGTEFNLKAYAGEENVTATLVKGSLKVCGGRQSTVLKPAQKVIFDREKKKMVILELTDLSPEIEWRNGRLVFLNQSLEELKPKLERWFDVEIQFADHLVKERKFTGTIERESILNVISYFDRSKYVASRIEDNTIIFYTE